MTSAPWSDVRRIVVLDFDGTVALGDAPVEAYLEAVLAGRTDGAASAARERLAAHLAGRDDAADGYAVVAAIADALGVDPGTRGAAYRSSRAALHDGRTAVTAPDGLAAALAGRPADVASVLVTNAPAAGIERVLDRLGLAGLLDEVVGDAGKPSGMAAVLERLLDGRPADRLLSVGDIWDNDLAPAAALGCATAAVDRHDRREGDPTLRARTLTALLPDLERWWSA